MSVRTSSIDLTEPRFSLLDIIRITVIPFAVVLLLGFLFGLAANQPPLVDGPPAPPAKGTAWTTNSA